MSRLVRYTRAVHEASSYSRDHYSKSFRVSFEQRSLAPGVQFGLRFLPQNFDTVADDPTQFKAGAFLYVADFARNTESIFDGR